MRGRNSHRNGSKKRVCDYASRLMRCSTQRLLRQDHDRNEETVSIGGYLLAHDTPTHLDFQLGKNLSTDAAGHSLQQIRTSLAACHGQLVAIFCHFLRRCLLKHGGCESSPVVNMVYSLMAWWCHRWNLTMTSLPRLPHC